MGWKIRQNLHHNEPGLSASAALLFALIVAFFGLAGGDLATAERIVIRAQARRDLQPAPWEIAR